jgi:hypothetical protein
MIHLLIFNLNLDFTSCIYGLYTRNLYVNKASSNKKIIRFIFIWLILSIILDTNVLMLITNMSAGFAKICFQADVRINKL